MNTDSIKNIFIDYIDTKETKYALVLNGKWGCGKTYFWDKVLKKLAEQKKFKTIYVSLNGLSKISDIEQKLFIKMIPYFGNQENPYFKNITKILSNVANHISKLFLGTTTDEIFKGVSIDTFNFTNYIVCFDDLERCQVPIKEVLGFINNFIEHRNLKSIIIADEENFDSNQSDYNSIKEKVIGRVLYLQLDIEDILPKLFNRFIDSNQLFYSFLNQNKETIFSILKDYEQNNLRIIGFYLDILEKLYPSLINESENIIYEIIYFSALISFEFKNGNLKSQNYRDNKGLDNINEIVYSLNLFNETGEIDPKSNEIEISYQKQFYKKYLERSSYLYTFFPSVYVYILTGFLDKDSFKNEIKARHPDSISKETQAFSSLLMYKFRELTDEDFKILSGEVLNYAKEGKYFIYDYIQIANFFYFFSDNKLIPESKEELSVILKQGLNISKNSKLIEESVFENLFHFGNKNQETNWIYDEVKTIHSEIKREKLIEKSYELIECLVNKDPIELNTIFKQNNLSKDFIQYIDSDKLIETILNISNHQLFNFNELISTRYNISNIGDFLYEDLVCLTKLKEGISNYFENTKDIKPLRKMLLSDLEISLSIIQQKLESTKTA